MSRPATTEKFDNPVVQWIDERLPIFTMLIKEYGVFPMPKNANYMWSFGGIALTMLIIMIVSGVVLAMHYTPHEAYAFNSVERIMRDVNYGWLLRYIHMNGASFFFIAVYIHISRGLYYGSYKAPREILWIVGVIIFLLMMATAFMGYTLPWSQMSGWGVTVITSLFSAFPLVGDALVTWLWGGFSVGNPTLNRFFALHFLLPFVILGVVFIHVWALHITGSNNPTGVEPKTKKDTVPFHPYFSVKDGFALVVFMTVFMAVTFFAPLALSEYDHFNAYDFLVTPPHIVPEWYFLPFYAILKSFTMDVTVWMTLLAAFGAVAAGGFAYLTMGNRKCALWAALGAIAASGFLFFITLASIVTAGLKDPTFMSYMNVVVVPAKLQGVLAMFGSILLLFFLPWIDGGDVKSARYRPAYKACLAVLLVAFITLGYTGAQLPEGWPVLAGKIATFYYFAHFLVLLPYLSRKGKNLPVPESISADPCCASKGNK
jgi:ubiquinol-cytochrome c reductase cytochrome b subunit